MELEAMEKNGDYIEVRLGQLLYDNKMTLTELSEKIGITLANLSIMKQGKGKAIRFSTLCKICRVLDCQPGDLMEYVPQDD